MHDLVIRNGLVVDGSGAAPFRADIAVDGDTISAIGEVSDAGALPAPPLLPAAPLARCSLLRSAVLRLLDRSGGLFVHHLAQDTDAIVADRGVTLPGHHQVRALLRFLAERTLG